MSDGLALAAETGATFNPLVDICIARHGRNGLMGGVLCSNYTGRGGSVSMHVAGMQPHWVSHDLLWVSFDYPFNQLGVKKIFGQVPVSNKQAIDFDLKLGFRPELVIKDVYPDCDMLLLSMYREHCRFLDMQPRSLRRGSTDGW
jgi:hypothetical protein